LKEDLHRLTHVGPEGPTAKCGWRQRRGGVLRE